MLRTIRFRAMAMCFPSCALLLTLMLGSALVAPALAQTGTVKGHQKISDTAGGFAGTLDDSDLFGTSVSSLGDLDGDGMGDLAVGVDGDDDGGF